MVSRIVILATIILAVCSAVAAQLTCMTDDAKCAEDECCVQIGPVGICRNLLEADNFCEVKPLTHLVFKHMYLHRCPCGDGLKCQGKEGLVGRFVGRCEEDDAGDDAEEGPDGPNE